jgi:hypothetical protein
LTAAAGAGLRVVERPLPQPGVPGLLRALEELHEVDVVSLRSPLDSDSCRVLFRGSAAVLANSGREPFGLVGLETMAVGGVACTGCSGEDYAVPGRNALVLETNDPQEFLRLFGAIHTQARWERALRRTARSMARHYAWPQIIRRLLLPRLDSPETYGHFGRRTSPLDRTALLGGLGQDTADECDICHREERTICGLDVFAAPVQHHYAQRQERHHLGVANRA